MKNWRVGTVILLGVVLATAVTYLLTKIGY